MRLCSISVFAVAAALLAGCGNRPAHPAAQKGPSAKIQGELIDAGTNRPAVTQSATNPLPAAGFAMKDGYLVVDFDRLASFDCTLHPASITNPATAKTTDVKIPAAIRALDNKKVVVEGYSLPLDMDDEGKVKNFLITRNPMCCIFGAPIRVNELVAVTMTGKGIPAYTGVPVTIEGTLHVGVILDNGEVTDVYRMDGEASVDE